MARSKLRPASALIYLLGVVGCTTTNDPHAGGFVSGVTNLANGGYDRRVQTRESELGDLQEVNRQLDMRHAEIEAQRNSLRAERDALTAQLTQLDQKNSVARQRLSDARRTQVIAQAKLTALIAEQRAIEAEIVPLVRRAQLRSAVIPASFGGTDDTPKPEDLAAIDVDRKKAADLADRQRKIDQTMDDVLGPAPKP